MTDRPVWSVGATPGGLELTLHDKCANTDIVNYRAAAGDSSSVFIQRVDWEQVGSDRARYRLRAENSASADSSIVNQP